MRETLFAYGTVPGGILTPIIEVQIPLEETWRILKIDVTSLAGLMVGLRMEHNRRSLVDAFLGPESLSLIYDDYIVGGGVLRIGVTGFQEQPDTISAHVMVERKKTGTT